MNFSKYPKVRPPLPEKLQPLHEQLMTENRQGKSLGAKLSKLFERWLHVKIAEFSPTDLSQLETLEIGAGRLNHLEYEPASMAYDIVEPRSFLFDNLEMRQRIRCAYSDVSEISPSQRYDRILSVAVLEHVLDLPAVVAQAALRLKDRGNFYASIPSEGELPWHLACAVSTGIEFRLRTGFSYRELMKHEHVNTAEEIGEVLEYFFKRVDCHVLGLFRGMSIYQFYHCTEPRVQRCQETVKNIAKCV